MESPLPSCLSPDQLFPDRPPYDWLPLSRHPKSIDHDLQLHSQTHSITACKCAQSWTLHVQLQSHFITAFMAARSWSYSASPTSHNYGLQVHLGVHLLSASKCISTLAWLWPKSAFSLFIYFWPLSASLNPNCQGFQLPHHILTTTVWWDGGDLTAPEGK